MWYPVHMKIWWMSCIVWIYCRMIKIWRSERQPRWIVGISGSIEEKLRAWSWSERWEMSGCCQESTNLTIKRRLFPHQIFGAQWQEFAGTLPLCYMPCLNPFRLLDFHQLVLNSIPLSSEFQLMWPMQKCSRPFQTLYKPPVLSTYMNFCFFYGLQHQTSVDSNFQH